MALIAQNAHIYELCYVRPPYLDSVPLMPVWQSAPTALACF